MTGFARIFPAGHQGSVIAMTDNAGNITESMSYDEYGNGTPLTGEQFGYTGRRFDPETGLYYYRARYYAPQLGRFLQTDPVGDKDDIDLYSYVGNDPLDKTDPTGNFGWHCTSLGNGTSDCEADGLVANGIMNIYVAINNYIMTHWAASSSSSPSDSSAPAPTPAPAPVSTPAPPDPDKPPHGNSNSSKKPQHRYTIRDKRTGDVKKTGISGQPLNQNGTSPRANPQVNAANNAAGKDVFEAKVEQTNIPSRELAKQAEKSATDALNAQGHSLDWQTLPQPTQPPP
jgi:RHS repeat-associated protein